jgi:hypothetical protein
VDSFIQNFWIKIVHESPVAPLRVGSLAHHPNNIWLLFLSRVPTNGVLAKSANNSALHKQSCSLFHRLLYAPTVHTLGKYSPGHCNPVPTIRVVGHSTYDATLTAHTQATCLLLKYERVVGIQTVLTTPHLDKYW